MQKLRPCAHCDSPAELLRVPFAYKADHAEEFFKVKCTLRECQNQTNEWYPAAAAITAWNTSHSDKLLERALEALQSAKLGGVFKHPDIIGELNGVIEVIEQHLGKL